MGNFDLSDWVDLITLFVAFLSLIMSIVFSRLQQKHNRNSVRPIASIQLSDYEDCIRVSILNAGTGPLIINKLTITDSKDKTIKSQDLISLMPRIHQSWNDYTTELEENVIPINGEIALISLIPVYENDKNEVRSALMTKIVTVEYRDIYGTKFTAQRKCEFFGRLITPKD